MTLLDTNRKILVRGKRELLGSPRRCPSPVLSYQLEADSCVAQINVGQVNRTGELWDPDGQVARVLRKPKWGQVRCANGTLCILAIGNTYSHTALSVSKLVEAVNTAALLPDRVDHHSTLGRASEGGVPGLSRALEFTQCE
jgi:hypothetical protein